MATYTARVETDWTQEQAFEYLADFSTVSEWDPGVPEARCISDNPLAVGSRFEVEVKNAGVSSTFTYETIELEAPRRVVLRAEQGPFISLDTMTFERSGERTEVTYEANLKLKGPLALIDPLLKIGFNRVAGKAEKGLADRLSGPPPAR